MSKTILYRGAVYREADTKRELFRQYCTQWGKVGVAWAKEILDDERKSDSGDEIWEAFAAAVPTPIQKVNPFALVKANMWIFDNMPTESQWVADLVTKNAKQRGVQLGDTKTGKYGVEANPSRYKKYMEMPAGAPPSFINANTKDVMFGVGRFIAAMMRNDDFMYVIPVSYSEENKKRAYSWLEGNLSPETKEKL